MNGVAIKGHPKSLNSQDSPLTTFWKIFRSYFYKPARGKLIRIEVDSELFEVRTDNDGNFEILLTLKDFETIFFYDDATEEPLNVLMDRESVFPRIESKFYVISDIDDTILVSHSARFFSKLWLMLFKPVDKRKTVEESELAYRALKSARIPFAYVSASEYNLFSLVSTFIELHKLPEGPIYLRPHQEWRELIHRTERSNYKVDRIKILLNHFQNRKIVFFGDDSQQDFTVFGEIALLFPERIHSVYLRKTGSLKESKSNKVSWEMPGGEIPVHYYDSYTEIEDDINELIHEATRCY